MFHPCSLSFVCVSAWSISLINEVQEGTSSISRDKTKQKSINITRHDKASYDQENDIKDRNRQEEDN